VHGAARRRISGGRGGGGECDAMERTMTMSDDTYYDDSGAGSTMVMPEDYIAPGTPDVEMAPETIVPEGGTQPDPNYVDKQSEVDLALGAFTDQVARDAQQEPTSPWENVDLEPTPNSIFGPGTVDPR